MNLRSLFGAAGIAAIVASSAAAAGAQVAPAPYQGAPYQNAPPPPGLRQQSATNVAMMSERLGHMIDHLQRDARDYGGHRVAAVRALQDAAGELNAAAQFAAEHGYNIQVPPPRRNLGGVRRPPPTSDTQMMRAQQALEHMIGRLQRDSHDFGGHRAAAIDQMQHANAELIAAIQFAQAHAYAP